jgi:DNA-binding NarL/FixJ family response regulator
MIRSEQITVLLADDRLAVRQTLRATLAKDGLILIVGEARNGREAVELARKLRPTVILMDISMPFINGLQATRRILDERSTAKIIVLSAHEDDEYLIRAKEVGAAGFISKQSFVEVLTNAIHEVALGHRFFHPAKPVSMALEKGKASDRNAAAKAKRGRLSLRESKLLQLVAQGSNNRLIATTLRLSIANVERLLDALMAKLSIACMANLACYAIASGHVENDVVLKIT